MLAGTEDLEILEKQGNQLFPIFLKLENFNTLLVGAGNVGLEKLEAMLANSPHAAITIVADRVLESVNSLADNFPQLQIHQRVFQSSDLDNKELVVLATDNHELHKEIHKLCKEKGILLNVADTPELCDFYLGSIVKKGNLKIAISTNGKSPTIAKRIKEVLNDNIPSEIDESLENINKLRNTLSGDFTEKVKKLNEITAGLVTKDETKGYITPKKLSFIIWSIVVVFCAILFVTLYERDPEFNTFINNVNPEFYKFLAAGFVFAMIDGAIGMSYGVTTTTFSLSMGIPPASASTGVHISEILSNGIAGWMHYKMGNVNKKLFKLLVVAGIIGAVTGAYLLSSLEHYSHYTKPIISVYTFSLGVLILRKAFLAQQRAKKKIKTKKITKIKPLGFFGGFIDAVGGGGWGTIVLSSLIAGGRHARFSLGSVKLSRFFIALMSSLTFITMLDNLHWYVVSGLVLGSAIASPIAAKVSNKISAKSIMVAVGVIVILASSKNIIGFILSFFRS
ncbi:siroheme synthase [Pseudopedobacter saltans DSM 12145]|uniref:Probable membrane transporter protein n=1 Tax=Pseudopedobacter saltans (strain ATCC 51119 / DSM 12145 / JCM 21818 / CCUG 39354 / LMG 10337 / NBRC 100064 / NCIMB 13643) TaxID=762903 RepID=F0SEF8_PSESL|nr:TSUP family transporter [Pseudopedobacter saltans]ADY50823.1 siroheme synthase [Pseudopedobacter saltans DSM 12145]